MEEGYMAIDQYGQTHHLGFTKHPRKALLEKFGRKRAAKMFVDKNDKSYVHIGYVIAGLWLTLYKVQRMEKVV